jgi:hypothetical protein
MLEQAELAAKVAREQRDTCQVFVKSCGWISGQKQVRRHSIGSEDTLHRVFRKHIIG